MKQEAKHTYQICNWAEYNKSLIQRGSITFWFSEEAIEKWHNTSQSGEKGRPQVYSDEAIVCALLIRLVFHLPLRGLEGFLRSLVSLLGLVIQVPSYTQICRRTKKLDQALLRFSKRRPTDIVFDSTGLKVYGEGEWKVKKHGSSKRRVWRKLHVGLDPHTGEILMGEVTGNGEGCGDAETAGKMLKNASKRLQRVYGDGAYDSLEFRRIIESLGAEAIIPPPKGAVVHFTGDRARQKRNDSLAEIRGLGGDEEARKLWKILKGYHKRSLVETGIYRIKQITGSNLRSRTYEGQVVEGKLKCLVVNKMTKLGMPMGRWV